MDAGGRWHASEQPGPSGIESWRERWAIYTTVAIMLNIATPATLSRYAKRFEERANRYPRAWHLCVLAESRCRLEFSPSERRRQQRFQAEHPQMTAYDPARPWESVMREAATSVEFWLRELQEPALLYASSAPANTNPVWTQQQMEQDGGGKRNATTMLGNGAGSGERAVCRNFIQGRCNYELCRRLHICEICKDPSHGAVACPKANGNAQGKTKKGHGKQGQQKKGAKLQWKK